MRITREELITKMEARGYTLTRAMLGHWAGKYLIPHPKRVSGGRASPPRAVYPSHVVRHVGTILKMRRQGKRLTEIDRYLWNTHVTKLIHDLEKCGLQFTNTYKNLRQWQNLSWGELPQHLKRGAGGLRNWIDDWEIVRRTYDQGTKVKLWARDIESRHIKQELDAEMAYVGALDKITELLELTEKQGLTRKDIGKLRNKYAKTAQKIIERLKKLDVLPLEEIDNLQRIIQPQRKN